MYSVYYTVHTGYLQDMTMYCIELLQNTVSRHIVSGDIVSRDIVSGDISVHILSG